MEAMCRTWEKLLAVEEDALKSGGGGADEFLNRGKDGLSAGSVEEEGEVCWRIYKVTPPQKSGFWIGELFSLERHGALLRQPFEGNNYD